MQKKCLITGSSHGLGRSLVREYRSRGYHVSGVSRTQDLESDHWISADFSKSDAVENLLTQLQGVYDVVIFNAGVNHSTSFEKMTKGFLQDTVMVNLLSHVQLFQGLWSQQQLREQAHCVWVCSMATALSYPGSAVYGAVKQGMAALAEQLQVVVPKGLHIMTVYPGPMNTQQARENSPHPEKARGWSDPDEVAQQIFQGMCRRRRFLYPGKGLRVLSAVCCVFPGLGSWLMAKTVWEPMQKKGKMSDTLPSHSL